MRLVTVDPTIADEQGQVEEYSPETHIANHKAGIAISVRSEI
jgi:hypothetical protein